MQYISTRGTAPKLNFEDVVLAGLASDGGLYVPESLPKFTDSQIRGLQGASYESLAFEIMRPFVGDVLNDDELSTIIEKAYSSFNHVAIAPLTQIEHNRWILELFHGPTLAFKDFALQFLGHLLDFLLERQGKKVVVLGATSGDTGSAAIEGCRRCDNLDIFILHPYQRVSDVQRRQMTSVIADNVYNLAVKGNFDDCQNIVKHSFGDQSFLPENRQLVAVNSINWARIMAQIVYYFYAALALGSPDRKVSFSVPTGNFGDIYAGYLAKQMGLPVADLVIATNENDILHRCISNNDYSKHDLYHSFAPSMDIMVSSNFERLLFDLYDQDGAKIYSLMESFKSGSLTLDNSALARARAVFKSARQDGEQLMEVMASVYKNSGYLLDPHTAIGYGAGIETGISQDIPLICLATAHPAKFPEAVSQSGVNDIATPKQMEGLKSREEAYTVLENKVEQVHDFIRQAL